MKTLKMMLTILVIVPMLLITTTNVAMADCEEEVQDFLGIVTDIDREISKILRAVPALKEHIMEVDKWCTKASRNVKISIKDGVMDENEIEYVKRVQSQIPMHNLEFRKYPSETRNYYRLVDQLNRKGATVRRLCRKEL